MRWLQINCVLIAGFAILSATNAEGSRDKRDLALIKNIIHTAIFGSENKTTPPPIIINNEENVRVFKIPGIDNILIKAIPKVPVAVADPRIIKIVPISVAEQQKASIVERPHVLFDTTTICDEVPVIDVPRVIQTPTFWQHPLLSIFHRPIPFPNVIKPVKPVEVPVPVLPSKYSYKQIHGDGKVTTYTSNDNRNVMVTESYRADPLPPFLTYRVQEAMKLGAQGIQDMPAIPIFQGHIRQPMVQYFDSPKVNFYPPTPVNYFYKQVHKDGTATSYTSDLKGDNIVVTQTGTVPTHTEFITDRIEKVAATSVIGPHVGQIHFYKQPINSYPKIDIRGGVQVKVDSKNQQETNVAKGTYSYQTIHKDGTVTNHLNEATATVLKKPEGNVNATPINPAHIENRLESIAQSSGGSFSYKILHNDGSVTNYGVFGVHEGVNGENKIIPLEKKTPIFQTSTPQLNKDGSKGSFTYRATNSDGSVSSYSSASVVEEKGASASTSGNSNEKNQKLDESQRTAQISDITRNRAIANMIHQGTNASSQNVNPSTGSFSYKAVHNDGSMTIYSQNGVSEINSPQKESMVHDLNSVNDNKEVQKTQQSSSTTEKVKGPVSIKQNMNFEDTKLYTNSIDDSKPKYEHTSTTDVIPAAPVLSEISSNVLTVSPDSTLVADSNKLLLTKPRVSSYSYKQIIHNQPDQFAVAVNIDDATADPVPNDYVYIPPATTNEAPLVRPLVPVEEIHIGTLNPPSAVVMTPVEDVTCVDKLSEHPIVVLDEPMSYSYEHRKVDGSAVIMKSDQSVVSVTISPKIDNVKRGDIP